MNDFRRVKGDQNHHIYRRGDVYWVRFRKGGKRALQESLETTNITDARIRRDERIAAYLGVRARHQGAELVGELFLKWISLNEAKWSAGTYVSVRNQWEKHLSTYYANHLVSDAASESEWLSYVRMKREKSPDRKFFNDRKYLSMFLNWCHREGLLDRPPRIPDVDPEVNAGRALDDSEIEALLYHAEADLYLQILMAITMGMRVGEILSLEWTQIDFKTGAIHLPAHKTKIRKARTFIASPEALSALSGRRENSASPWVFPSPADPGRPVGKSGNKTAWRNCRRRSGVSCRFHDLRHTFLTRAFKTATNPALICHYAGLSLEEAERTYLHFTVDDTAKVAQIVRVEI